MPPPHAAVQVQAYCSPSDAKGRDSNPAQARRKRLPNAAEHGVFSCELVFAFVPADTFVCCQKPFVTANTPVDPVKKRETLLHLYGQLFAHICYVTNHLLYCFFVKIQSPCNVVNSVLLSELAGDLSTRLVNRGLINFEPDRRRLKVQGATWPCPEYCPETSTGSCTPAHPHLHQTPRTCCGQPD